MRPVNRKSKMLLGVLAFLLTMSIGYAYFSKQIEIGANVTAKGSFKIDITCSKSISNEFVTAGYFTSSEISEMQYGYSTDSCTVSGSKVTMSTGLDYPGATRFYTIVVKNSGGIPAKWSYEDGFEHDYTMCYGSNASECENYDETGFNYIAMTDTLWGTIPSIRHAAKKTSSGTFTVIIDEDIGDLVDDEGYIYLQPGESLYFIGYNLWNGQYYDDDDYNYAQGNYLKWTSEFRLNFEQGTPQN